MLTALFILVLLTVLTVLFILVLLTMLKVLFILKLLTVLTVLFTLVLLTVFTVTALLTLSTVTILLTVLTVYCKHFLAPAAYLFSRFVFFLYKAPEFFVPTSSQLETTLPTVRHLVPTDARYARHNGK